MLSFSTVAHTRTRTGISPPDVHPSVATATSAICSAGVVAVSAAVGLRTHNSPSCCSVTRRRSRGSTSGSTSGGGTWSGRGSGGGNIGTRRGPFRITSVCTSSSSRVIAPNARAAATVSHAVVPRRLLAGPECRHYGVDIQIF